jgi:predicted GTPase
LKQLEVNINEVLIQRIEKNRETLQKKKRAVNNFTISFIGKTKAGKSTLHSVITGEGEEFIGVGKQRTTRYNRVYSWKKVRIIDTPGIGAPGGKTDEEIAASVIDESDVICYVLKNDSIQSSEFEFLKHIRDKNKPVIILLNVKENLENESRLKLYLKDPDKWHTRKDEKSLEGHINRIKRYAQEHYKNNYFKVHPVQLLAAKMSQSEQYKNSSKTLYKSSRLDDFLDSLRVSIINEGVIKRSQTILDGTLCLFDETEKYLLSLKEPLIKMSSKLKEKNQSLKDDLDKEYSNCKKQLKVVIDDQFNSLIEKTYDFASRHYDSSEETIKSSWESYIKKVGFTDGLQSSVSSTINSYSNSVQEYLDEIVEDLEGFNEFSFKDLNANNSTSFSFRHLLSVENLLSTLGALASFFLISGPWGWVVGGITLLAMFVRNIFKSKARKMREATDKLYSSLCSSIEAQREKNLKEITGEFKKLHTKVLKGITSYFNLMALSLDSVVNNINPVENELMDQQREINKVLAWRTLNYIRTPENIPTAINFNDIKGQIDSVERKFGEYFKIKSKIKVNAEKDISEVLQEKIIIEQA